MHGIVESGVPLSKSGIGAIRSVLNGRKEPIKQKVIVTESAANKDCGLMDNRESALKSVVSSIDEGINHEEGKEDSRKNAESVVDSQQDGDSNNMVRTAYEENNINNNNISLFNSEGRGSSYSRNDDTSGSFSRKRKRTKTRSKQKNIRKDNRPDAKKPVYLQAGASLDEYKGRMLTEQTKQRLGINN